MELGAFSVSLAVKDIEASKLFYEKLGFTVFAGDQSQNWLIMKNGTHNIGLFQGMFENNIKNQIQKQTSPPTSTDYLAAADWVCGILPTAR